MPHLRVDRLCTSLLPSPYYVLDAGGAVYQRSRFAWLLDPGENILASTLQQALLEFITIYLPVHTLSKFNYRKKHCAIISSRTIHYRSIQSRHWSQRHQPETRPSASTESNAPLPLVYYYTCLTRSHRQQSGSQPSSPATGLSLLQTP